MKRLLPSPGLAGLTLMVALAIVQTRAPAAAAPAEMTTTASGLTYMIPSHGTGAPPKAGQVVVAHYVGSLQSSGRKFDSSRDRGEPFAFTLGKGRVIRGWDEGFALLRIGDKATLIVPPELAYGDRQRGPIPANSTLRFEVELLDIKEHALADALQETLDAAGVEPAQRRFEELRAAKFDGLYVSESQLNGLGYARLRLRRVAEAITVFQWNVALFPQSTNVHDSLGEAYAKDGQRDLAIKSYERALALDPKNTNAAKALAELKAAPKAP